MSETKSYMDNLENIAINFEKMNENYIFMKEKLSSFEYEEGEYKLKINFKECHVAICPNGGLIAICKKKGFLDITKGTKLNKYIVVMYQNGKRKILIPIDWNYKTRWVINLEFNEKEQLYAICNDGTIYKLDILTQRAVEKRSCEIFKNQPIIKAKLVEKGFIALTVDGNFLYAKDIKAPVAKLLFPMGSLLQFSTNIEFLAIPPSYSKSKKLELLITNEKGNGIIHIEENEGEGQFDLRPQENGLIECKGASILFKDKLEPYYINLGEHEGEENKDIGGQFEKLGKIAAMAISPKKDQIALYDYRGFVFFFYTDFEDRGEKKKVIIDLNVEYSSEELIEQQKVLNFEDGGQFMYCGEDAVAVGGHSFIFIVNSLSKPKVFKITENEKKDPTLGFIYFKCISEFYIQSFKRIGRNMPAFYFSFIL